MRFLARIRNHIRRLTGSPASAGRGAVLGWEIWHFAAALGLWQPARWRFHPRQALHPLEARLRGTSDLAVFDQIFIAEQYAGLRNLENPALVVDLGANVGFSAAYFLGIFPQARVVAVEPDERNLALCRSNLAPYGDRVRLLHGAVWSKAAWLRVLPGVFGDGREWATQVAEVVEERNEQWGEGRGEERGEGRGDEAGLAGETSVPAWDVGSLIDMHGGGSVDLLKVDIERAELAVFGETSAAWLGRVRNICIELHGQDCEQRFFAALHDFDYELDHSGELTICRNLRPRTMSGIVSPDPSRMRTTPPKVSHALPPISRKS